MLQDKYTWWHDNIRVWDYVWKIDNETDILYDAECGVGGE